MHIPLLTTVLALTAITTSFPAFLILRGQTDPGHTTTLIAKPIPTSALLAGVLAQNGDATNAIDIIEQDYGDLGGEQPIVKARKGIWGLLGVGREWRVRKSGEAVGGDEDGRSVMGGKGEVGEGKGESEVEEGGGKGTEDVKIEM